MGNKDWGTELLEPENARNDKRKSKEGPNPFIREMFEETMGHTPVWEPSKAASFGKQIIASLPVDPATRVAFFAGSRFPDLSPEEQAKRYRIHNGRIAYRSDDIGSGHEYDQQGEPIRSRRIWYYEEPEFDAPGGALPFAAAGPIPGMPNLGGVMVPEMQLTKEDFDRMGRAAQGNAKWFASIVGPSMGTAGGLTGAALTGGSPWGAAAGGAVGDMARQGIEAVTTGEERTMGGRIAQTTGSAALEGGGALVGRGLAKGADWATEAAQARRAGAPQQVVQAARTVTPEQEALAIQRQREAELATGSQNLLYPDELTGNPALRRLRVGSESSSEGAPIYLGDYERRNTEVSNGIVNLLRQISPQRSVRAGSQVGQEGAEATIRAEREGLAAQARPFYAAAEELPIEQTEAMASIANTSAGQAAMRRAQATLSNQRVQSGPEKLAFWDQTKKELDTLANMADKSGDATNASTLRGLSRDLRNELDRQSTPVSPDITAEWSPRAQSPYQTGRQIYEDGIPARTELQQGVVGHIARLKPEQADEAAKLLFGPKSSADEVVFARDAFNKAGQQDAWSALVRAHLQDELMTIGDVPTGTVRNLGTAYFQRVFGSPEKRQMMEEAFRSVSPDAGQNFIYLMNTLDAINEGARSRAGQVIVRDYENWFGRQGRGVIPAAVESVEFWRIPSRVASAVGDRNHEAFARRVAEIMTSGPDMATIQRYREMGISPRSAEGIVLGTQLLISQSVRNRE